jgi:hypothetical protein
VTIAMPTSRTMRVMLREARMVTERLCQANGVPDGLLASLTNCGVYSAALGLAGFPGMERQLDLLREIAPERMSAEDGEGEIRFDAAGQHAWVAAEPALDLLIASARTGGATGLRVANVLEAGELGVIAALAQKHHWDARIEATSEGGTLVRLRDRPAGAPGVLERIIREGIAVERELWFHLFHRSHDALAPDTVVSRTHTGSIIVKPDGTIIGKEDPEFLDMDLTMLTKDSLIRLEPTGSHAE